MKKKNKRWLSIYRPNNTVIVRIIEDTYKMHKEKGLLKTEDGKDLSLGSFILANCMRSIHRDIAINQAMEEGGKDVE